MIGVLAALRTVLAQGQFMAILTAQIPAGVVVIVLALRALEANKAVLTHMQVISC